MTKHALICGIDDHIEVGQSLTRAVASPGYPAMSGNLLDWRSPIDFDDLLRRLIAAEQVATAT